MQQVDDPPFLSVGTEVSAKYKGAFCEAKVRKVVRNIKCKVAYKQGLGSGTVSDDLIKGILRVGAAVEVKHPDKREYVEATITKIQDCSQYTVVFDDGDITTLRRTALCLKSGRHFNESETLDQLPLTHPEHFGNPVIGGRRGRRSRHLQDDSSDEDDDNDSKEIVNEKEEHIGKVVCVESTETKKKDKEKWFPGLVVSPTAQVTVRIRVKDEYLVRSFKDGRYYTVPKKEATEFTRELAMKQEGPAVQAALEYLDNNTLPTHWDKDALFGLANSSSEYEGEFDSDSSDDEPREEKDHFVAQLYKYMDDRGTPLNKVPSITNKEVDFYRLFRAVQKLGGYNRVSSQNQWKAITMRLGFNPVTLSVTNLVKQAYKRFLQPFEEFDRKLGCSMSMTPRNANRSKGRSLVRANSVASPKLELKETKLIITAEESENTSESSMDAIKSKRKLSTGSGKVKTLVEKFEEKVKEEVVEPPAKIIKPVVKEDTVVASTSFSASTTSNNNKKEKPTKKPPQSQDDKRGGGRKRKEGETEKGNSEKTIETPSITEFPVDVGDKLKVYYHEKKVTYEAKVIEISVQQGTPLYLVHYTGWNTRYDEWVPRERIAENLTTSKAKRSKGSSNQKSINTIPPNDGTKASATNTDKGPATTTLTTAPSSATKNIIASKRGRGRSDSQPPRSTTPSSMVSTSSRTKSPATPATQRRTTRAQPSLSRRTSNNISDISVQSDSESDSDEPVKKSVVKSVPSTTSTSNSPNQMAKGGPNKSASTSTITNNQSDETEEEDISIGPKGRDYDLNQIRSELKGFKELKSPSPEPDITSQLADGDKQSSNVFDFEVVDESDSKPLISNMSKSSLSATESKSSLSSETDSSADDDSQSSDKTTTLKNMTENFQQRIKAEKLALEKNNGGATADKILPIKSSGIEKIIEEKISEKIQESLKSKPFAIEKNIFKVAEKEEKGKSIPDISNQLKIMSLERKPAKVIPQQEKKPILPLELKSTLARPERKSTLMCAEKLQTPIKPITKEALPPLEIPTPKQIIVIAEKSTKESPKATTQIKLTANDIYEFKEPEPFEFETRKPSSNIGSPEIDKKPKKTTVQKSPPEIPITAEASTVKPSGIMQAPAKKNKKSPTKDSEKVKQIKIEENPQVPDASPIPSALLSPIKTDNTFDALRKSPSFNLNIITGLEESVPPIVLESVKVSSDSPERVTTPTMPPQKIIPFTSPFMQTIKDQSPKGFDLKADIERIENDAGEGTSSINKNELETVKRVLLAESVFDLEPPKIDKPCSIADKLLKALNQQKQDEGKVKEETETRPVIETLHLPVYPFAEPPKIELSAIIKKDIDLQLKKPLLSSPEPKHDILESIAPKNNDLSETIKKLGSAIQNSSSVDHFDDDSSDSTDSERRLVIEDDSQSSDNNQTDANEFPITAIKKTADFSEEKTILKGEIGVKEERYIFAPKQNIFNIPSQNTSDSAVHQADATVLKPIHNYTPPYKSELDTKMKIDIQQSDGSHITQTVVKKEENVTHLDNLMNRESINLLLCEETIPGSPTPSKESATDIKPNLHPIESDIKPIPMDIECSSIPSHMDPAKNIKHENTPNSSPRDSISQDESFEEDGKKQHEQDSTISPKKKRRARKHSEGEPLGKRRRNNTITTKRTNGSDSDDNNSDANLSQRSSNRSTRPCQYNFLVQLDPALNPNQRIAILKKKIQELRKTYNMIKAELASIDRRRKKLRRREREKKSQQKLNS